MPWPRRWVYPHRCAISQVPTLLKLRVHGLVATRPPQGACRSRRRTKRSAVNGDGEMAEMDAIGSTVIGTDTAAEAVAGTTTESGGRGKGTMKRSRGLAGMGEDTGAGAQVETEIDTGDTNAQKCTAVGAAVVVIGDAVEVEMEVGRRTNIVEGPPRGGGAQALGIGGDAETAWIKRSAT